MSKNSEMHLLKMGKCICHSVPKESKRKKKQKDKKEKNQKKE